MPVTLIIVLLRRPATSSTNMPEVDTVSFFSRLCAYLNSHLLLVWTTAPNLPYYASAMSLFSRANAEVSEVAKVEVAKVADSEQPPPLILAEDHDILTIRTVTTFLGRLQNNKTVVFDDTTTIDVSPQEKVESKLYRGVAAMSVVDLECNAVSSDFESQFRAPLDPESPTSGPGAVNLLVASESKPNPPPAVSPKPSYIRWILTLIPNLWNPAPESAPPVEHPTLKDAAPPPQLADKPEDEEALIEFLNEYP